MVNRSVFAFCTILTLLSGFLPAQTTSNTPAVDSAATPKKTGWTETVVDVAPEPTEASALALRKNRSAAFDDQTSWKRPLDAPDDGHGYGMAIDVAKIPPFPVSMGPIVVVVQIAAFQPFLSNDRTAIYTELRVNIERVFKDSEAVLSGISSLTVPELGGALRLPGGKIVKQFIPPSEMLGDVGARYVLFLTYDSKHNWFGVVKAWELQNGRVKAHSLTEVRDALHGTSKYDGMEEFRFLQEVENVVNGS